jgi:uncharacterized protein
MKINISGLTEGEHHYSYSEQPSVFDISSLEFVSNIDIRVSIHKSTSQIEVNANFDIVIKIICDRCLDDFIQKISKEFNLVYKYNYNDDPEQIDKLKDDNLKFISTDVKYIDITNDVRDYILLSVPMKKIPEEKDGVCLYCNRNISELLIQKNEKSQNPVWDKLREIKKSK